MNAAQFQHDNPGIEPARYLGVIAPAGERQFASPTLVSGEQQHLEALGESLLATLRDQGYCLLRQHGLDLDGFRQLMQTLCTEATYDPARDDHGERLQKVDAGTGAIGLHIENGNTPKVPEIIGFYCAHAASQGSETTLCDGRALFRAMDTEMREMASSELMVSRRLPEAAWRRYMAGEMQGRIPAAAIGREHVQQAIGSRRDIEIDWHEDGSITLTLHFVPLRQSRLSHTLAFANALLGPSFNYARPEYRYRDGRPLNQALLQRIAALAEQHTLDIAWQDEDIVIIDNWRVMHGRRAIEDKVGRELYISLGNMTA